MKKGLLSLAFVSAMAAQGLSAEAEAGANPMWFVSSANGYETYGYTRYQNPSWESSQLQSVKIWVPDASKYGPGPYPATTLMAGFCSQKESMHWLAEHLASHGFVVISATPDFGQGVNGEPDATNPAMWGIAQWAALNLLKSENSRPASKLYGKVKLNKINLMGHSMGGGGVTYLAGVNNEYASTIALAPYATFENLAQEVGASTCNGQPVNEIGPSMSEPNYAGIDKPFAVMIGTDDVVTDDSVFEVYSGLGNIEKLVAFYRGADHDDWSSDASDTTNRQRMRSTITAWLQVQLKNDNGAKQYLQPNSDWYSIFWYTDK